LPTCWAERAQAVCTGRHARATLVQRSMKSGEAVQRALARRLRSFTQRSTAIS
jgi:hypothetical protein